MNRDLELDSYIRHHVDKEPEWLRAIDRRTNLRLINGRMCSGHLQGRLLKMLVEMIRPIRALELGTFSGYSALCIAEGMPRDGQLDTFEIDDELEDFILENFALSPFADKIRLHIGDATTTLATWEKETVDFVFIDADKRSYPLYYETVLPLVLSLIHI